MARGAGEKLESMHTGEDWTGAAALRGFGAYEMKMEPSGRVSLAAALLGLSLHWLPLASRICPE